MNTDINYKNNPLNGLKLKDMIRELVEHYGYEILYAYLNLNCFRANPSLASSVKFLRKTDWAREKVETFYLYQFKSLPHPSSEQFTIPPRERIIPDHQKPGEPAILSLEDAARLNEKRAKKSPGPGMGGGRRSGSGKRPTCQGRGESGRSPVYSKNDDVDDSDTSGKGDDPWSQAIKRRKQ